MCDFTRSVVLDVSRHYAVPDVYHEDLVAYFTKRHTKQGADRLYKQLGLRFVMVNNGLAHLRWLASRGIRPPRGCSAARFLDRKVQEAVKRLK